MKKKNLRNCWRHYSIAVLQGKDMDACVLVSENFREWSNVGICDLVRYFVCLHYILMGKTKAMKRKYYYMPLLVLVAVVLVDNIFILINRFRFVKLLSWNYLEAKSGYLRVNDLLRFECVLSSYCMFKYKMKNVKASSSSSSLFKVCGCFIDQVTVKQKHLSNGINLPWPLFLSRMAFRQRCRDHSLVMLIMLTRGMWTNFTVSGFTLASCFISQTKRQDT